jgi:hypothetical protein
MRAITPIIFPPAIVDFFLDVVAPLEYLFASIQSLFT